MERTSIATMGDGSQNHGTCTTVTYSQYREITSEQEISNKVKEMAFGLMLSLNTKAIGTVPSRINAHSSILFPHWLAARTMSEEHFPRTIEITAGYAPTNSKYWF